jgi:hypothetical protein
MLLKPKIGEAPFKLVVVSCFATTLSARAVFVDGSGPRPVVHVEDRVIQLPSRPPNI